MNVIHITLEETGTKQYLGTVLMERLPRAGETISIFDRDKYYVEHVHHDIVEDITRRYSFSTKYRLIVKVL